MVIFPAGLVRSTPPSAFGLLGAIRRPVSVLKLGGMLSGIAIMLFGNRLYERFLH